MASYETHYNTDILLCSLEGVLSYISLTFSRHDKKRGRERDTVLCVVCESASSVER